MDTRKKKKKKKKKKQKKRKKHRQKQIWTETHKREMENAPDVVQRPKHRVPKTTTKTRQTQKPMRDVSANRKLKSHRNGERCGRTIKQRLNTERVK